MNVNILLRHAAGTRWTDEKAALLLRWKGAQGKVSADVTREVKEINAFFEVPSTLQCLPME